MPLVTIQLAVYNGEKYIRHCLRAVKAQTYPNLQVVIWDNSSTDCTRDIIKTEFPEYRLIEHSRNIGMWPAHEELLKRTHGTYILALSVDVIVDEHFVERAVSVASQDAHIGAIQAKVYQYNIERLMEGQRLNGHTIDSCGFSLMRDRTVRNIGHGEQDHGQYDTAREIFGVEGAVPFFRRIALEDCCTCGMVWDKDYFWYGDDLDLAWRMRLYGWREMFAPSVIAYHDRSTTRSHAHGIWEAIRHMHERRRIPLTKRRLDWANTRFTITKNDAIINILKDFLWILKREVMVCGYMLLFEPGVFLEIPRFLRLLPRMLCRRKEILARARITPKIMRRWFK